MQWALFQKWIFYQACDLWSEWSQWASQLPDALIFVLSYQWDYHVCLCINLRAACEAKAWWIEEWEKGSLLWLDCFYGCSANHKCTLFIRAGTSWHTLCFLVEKVTNCSVPLSFLLFGMGFVLVIVTVLWQPWVLFSQCNVDEISDLQVSIRSWLSEWEHQTCRSVGWYLNSENLVGIMKQFPGDKYTQWLHCVATESFSQLKGCEKPGKALWCSHWFPAL